MTLCHVVSVSGGKDSTATYLRAMERGLPFRAVFADTGNEHPLTYEYVRSLAKRTGGPEVEEVRADFAEQIAHKRTVVDTKWRTEGVSSAIIDRALDLLVPTGNPFVDLCLWKGRFPSSRRRFCTEELKTIPIAQHIHAPLLRIGKTVISWQGVRADESLARSVLPALQRLTVPETVATHLPGTLFAWRPLLKWTVEDVFKEHAKHGIEPNPLYAAGMGRVGCMPCIMCRKDELRQIADRFPEEIERIAEMESLVSQASKRGLSTFFSADKTPGAHTADFSLPMPRIHEVVLWSRTSRGGRQLQLDLLPRTDFASEVATTCDQWGACE